MYLLIYKNHLLY